MSPSNKKRAPLVGASSWERPFLQNGFDDKRAPLGGASSWERPFLQKGLDAKDDIRCNDDDPDLSLMTTCKEQTSRSELDPDISANLSEHDPDLPKRKKNKTRILLSPLSKDLEKNTPP